MGLLGKHEKEKGKSIELRAKKEECEKKRKRERKEKKKQSSMQRKVGKNKNNCVVMILLTQGFCDPEKPIFLLAQPRYKPLKSPCDDACLWMFLDYGKMKGKVDSCDIVIVEWMSETLYLLYTCVLSETLYLVRKYFINTWTSMLNWLIIHEK